MADDDADDRLLMRDAWDHDVAPAAFVEVEDGQQLLDYLGALSRRDHPDLLILDLNMPIVDGREALRAIKQNPLLRHLPTVVLSTSDAASDIELCYALGANSYLSKPSNFRAYKETLRALARFWFGIATRPQEH